MTQPRLTGGCQCGAVRYEITGALNKPSICHCRMCQKAFGSFFAPLAGVKLEKFEVTRGELAVFKSSDEAERGFCRNCGTPLSFHYVGSDRISISIGSFDRPERVAPAIQYGIEGRLPYFSELAALPGDKTTERGVWTHRAHRVLTHGFWFDEVGGGAGFSLGRGVTQLEFVARDRLWIGVL